MTDPAVTDPAVPQRRLAPSGAHVGLLGLLGLLAALVTLLVSLLAAPTASASPLIGAGNAVAPIAVPVGQPVGPHEAVLAGQGQARAPAYDQTAVGSCVGAETGAGVADAASQATAHGAERLAQAGFTEESIAATKAGQVFQQADGASVYLNETAPGRYDFIIEGDNGVVTAHTNWPLKSVVRLGNNYGWDWTP